MKKVFFILVIICIIGGAVFIALRFTKKESLRSYPNAPEGTAEVTALLTRDADDDGLKDWEEELWGTDTMNPDTDGDGATDGEEIRNRRNPLVKGPTDELDESSISQKTTLNASTTPENETDKLAREFFSTYLEIKKEGGQLSPESLTVLGEKLSESAPDLTVRTYTESDLILSQNSDVSAIRAYGNMVGSIIASVPPPPESELDVLRRAAETEDQRALETLDPIIAGYAQLLSELKGVAVPAGAEREHLELLQSIDGIKTSIEQMRQLFKNPVMGLPAVTLHRTSTDKLIQAFKLLDEYFLVHDIVFKAGEGGYLITRLSV